ncbi:MAG: cytochrome c [Stappiaceae bacterium]
MKRYLFGIVVATCLVVALLVFFNRSQNHDDNANAHAGAPVDISIPSALSGNAQVGKKIFQSVCATCHGRDAVGKDGVAPPLVHKIYEPSHHGDEAFQRAVVMGVRSHHWPFGNMPPIKELTRADVAMIVAYVRELQQANGIN